MPGAAVRAGAVLTPLELVTREVMQVTNHTCINAEPACALLREVADKVAGPVTLVLDNARYQKCAVVRESAAGFMVVIDDCLDNLFSKHKQ